MRTHEVQPLRVGVHPVLAGEMPEISYVLRTLLILAGYPYDISITDAGEAEPLDIAVGPSDAPMAATLRIPCAPHRVPRARALEPVSLRTRDGLPWLDFGEGTPGLRRDGTSISLGADLILPCFWMLSGAGESGLELDRWERVRLGGAFIGRSDVLRTPIVSIYATWLRELFRAPGREPLLPPWARPGETTAFAFSHDVHYPEIVRLIEVGRVLLSRGARGLPLAARVLAGRSHFWNFPEWMAFERALGARGAFYFMARRGSLMEYALGTPDGFYDVRSRKYRELFRALREGGFEIGLHASFNAHKSLDQVRREKTLLEEVAGVEVRGNRHHHWRLDPRVPEDTLRMHESVRLSYDSSLAFELHPGFRRGCCHPFRPFHAGERRAIDVVQLPPAWIDDHFDRRLPLNRIESPETEARALLDVVRHTGGVAVVSYDERRMNPDLYPRCATWLGHFLRETADSSFVYHRPCDVAEMFASHERMLESRSRERRGGRERVAILG